MCGRLKAARDIQLGQLDFKQSIISNMLMVKKWHPEQELSPGGRKRVRQFIPERRKLPCPWQENWASFTSRVSIFMSVTQRKCFVCVTGAVQWIQCISFLTSWKYIFFGMFEMLYCQVLQYFSYYRLLAHIHKSIIRIINNLTLLAEITITVAAWGPQTLDQWDVTWHGTFSKSKHYNS